ncbi:MAG: hypothetical protein WCN27_03900, partial [Alphaproteobacteria bacterium]
NSAIAGLTGNANFTFTTQLSDLVTAEAVYVTKLGLVATGGNTAVTVKDTAKGVVEGKLAVAAKAVNLQANGDLAKLQSSGLPLVKLPVHNNMGVPANFDVERDNIAGYMKVSVDTPIYGTHGTIIAFWKPELGPTPANINDWFFRHSNGHSYTITGLRPNVPYPFAAAYKGNDNEPLVWTAIMIKSAGD